MSITIDSITYNIPIKILNRRSEILFKYAERTEDGVLHSEAIGTYYNYDLECGMSKHNISDYAALWLKLTEPTGTHEITLPDESDTLTFDCYFANIRDDVVRRSGTQNYFRNLSFSVIAISPARVPA